MTLVARRPTPTRARRGWRATRERRFPTLGWQVLEWTYAFLPSPTDENARFVFTDEQARRVLRMYELDPETGERLYRRVHEEEAKGWGKSPEAAALALAELCGPVCFDGWDAQGQPVGVRWGTHGRIAPWVQIAAVSEDQTENTYSSLYGLLTSADHRAARDLRIDEGRTRLYLRDMPEGRLERVTASAGSREGQRITHAVLDEPQLWTAGNTGDVLARVVMRNLAKSNGWAHFTGNSPVMGHGSVAELYGEPAPGALHFATRVPERPTPDWSDDRLLAALGIVYRGVPWVSLSRFLDEIRDTATPWSDSLRFYFNVRLDARDSIEALIPKPVWEEASGDVILKPSVPTFACVTVSHDHRDAAIATAQRDGDVIQLRMATFPDAPLPAGEIVDAEVLEAYVRSLRRRYPADVAAARPGHTRPLPTPGPEVTYHGAFFAASAQRLERDKIVLVDAADSPERLAGPAHALKSAALEGRLVHDGNSRLATQLGMVVAKPVPRGERVENAGPAARAAMVAVDRALNAPRATSRALHHGAPR